MVRTTIAVSIDVLNEQIGSKKHLVGCAFLPTHLFLIVLKQSLHVVSGNNVRTHRMIPKSTDLLTNKLLYKLKIGQGGFQGSEYTPYDTVMMTTSH